MPFTKCGRSCGKLIPVESWRISSPGLLLVCGRHYTSLISWRTIYHHEVINVFVDVTWPHKVLLQSENRQNHLWSNKHIHNQIIAHQKVEKIVCGCVTSLIIFMAHVCHVPANTAICRCVGQTWTINEPRLLAEIKPKYRVTLNLAFQLIAGLNQLLRWQGDGGLLFHMEGQSGGLLYPWQCL